MPRSPAQSDFVVERPAEVILGELPRAVARSTEASARATRWVMGITLFMLAVLAILCAVGPHIPSGE